MQSCLHAYRMHSNKQDKEKINFKTSDKVLKIPSKKIVLPAFDRGVCLKIELGGGRILVNGVTLTKFICKRNLYVKEIYI